MKKKFRPLIIGLIVLLVAGAGYWLLITLTPPAAEPENPDSGVEYLSLVNYPLAQLDHIRFEFDDGYSYTLQVTHKSEISRSYSILGKEQFAYDSTTLSTGAMAMASISTGHYTEEGSPDLTLYGLDSPRQWVEYTGTDGSQVRLALGDETRVGSYTYAMKEGDTRVYMISSYTTRYLQARDYFYRKLSVLSYEDPLNEIEDFSIVDQGTAVLTYHRNTDAEMETSEEMYVRLYMREPIAHPINETLLDQEVTSKLTDLRAAAVVEDFPKDLSVYGLTEDVTVISLKNVDGTNLKITLSQPGEDGLRYGTVSGIHSVMTFKDADLSFIKVDYKPLLYKLLWSYQITDVARVEIAYDGDTHVMEVFDPTTEESEAGQVFHATFDGVEMREENARRLYIRVLSPSIYDIAEDQPVDPQPAMTIRIILENGQEDSMSFHSINERRFAALRRGESTGFYINLTDLNAIRNAVTLIQKNDLIPNQ